VGVKLFHADGQMDGQTKRETDGQMDGQTKRQTDGQTWWS